MKDILTTVESAVLIEKGVSEDKATRIALCRGLDESGWSEPIFRFTDLFHLLPKTIKRNNTPYVYHLDFYWDDDVCQWVVMYIIWHDAMRCNVLYKVSDKEFIDALYRMVIELLDNHVALNLEDDKRTNCC